MVSFAALLKNDIRLILRDWKACVLLLAAPLIFISFFTYALSQYLEKSSFIEPFPIALVDKENTTQTRMLIHQIEDIGIFSHVIVMDEEDALRYLADKEVGGVIIIPEDFTNSVAIGENRPVTVVGNGVMPLQAYIVKNTAQSAANLVTAAQGAINTIWHYDNKAGLSDSELDARFNEAVMDYMLTALARTAVFESVEAENGSSVTPAEYFTAALIVVFMMFAGMPGMKMLVSERAGGITARLAATPVRMWKVVLSKLLVSIMLLVIQFGIIILMTSRLFNNYWGAPVRDVLILFGAIILAVSAWSVFTASISPTPASADIIGNLGILLMAVLGGSIYPLTSMPESIRRISVLTINRWAMEGFMVLFSGSSVTDTGTHAMVLALMALILFAVSAFMIRFARRR
ncbi:MAG TPA: ABC transporter permease [Clostridiales bacterium]|nr:ABC transporter permease [Clostridiales bacterium]HPZ04816.1 ABC transporter permease [Clostridiales bacterium]HQD30071.1 ABC transporter permease [Clostridiales bacterium]